MRKIVNLKNRLKLALAELIIDPVTMAKKKGVKLGNNCKLNKKITWGSEPYLISIGDDFYCSTNITFITHDGAIHLLRLQDESKSNYGHFGPINIGDKVFIGYGVTILPNSKIGSNVIVGAGSLVKGELRSNSVYAGVPAKYICSLEDYLRKVTPLLDEVPKLDLDKRKYLSKKYQMR